MSNAWAIVLAVVFILCVLVMVMRTEVSVTVCQSGGAVLILDESDGDRLASAIDMTEYECATRVMSRGDLWELKETLRRVVVSQ